MAGREKACIWVAYARAFAQCLLEMKGNADHPAAHRLVRPMSLQGAVVALHHLLQHNDVVPGWTREDFLRRNRLDASASAIAKQARI